MTHTDVDIFNQQGDVVGTKPRDRVGRLDDIHRSVFVIIVTPKHEFVLSKISRRGDGSRLYDGLIGWPAATFRRHGEDDNRAAHRALQEDVGIQADQLRHLGISFDVFPNGSRRWTSVFVLTHGGPLVPKHNSTVESMSLTTKEMRELVKDKTRCAPTVIAVWEHYQTLI